jgi:hypothetical protein
MRDADGGHWASSQERWRGESPSPSSVSQPFERYPPAPAEDGTTVSPAAQALAGLRANEARYFNKYDHVFTVSPASEEPKTLGWLNRILADERGIVISARPFEVTSFEVDGDRAWRRNASTQDCTGDPAGP